MSNTSESHYIHSLLEPDEVVLGNYKQFGEIRQRLMVDHARESDYQRKRVEQAEWEKETAEWRKGLNNKINEQR